MTMTMSGPPPTSSISSNAAKYDLNVNPVYQIDMTTASTGKMVAQTKRRVRWRFGFSNKTAIQEGGKGTDCRGEEHEVTLIWSLTSGKRLVLMDGKEVHYSMGKPTSGKFQTSWTMRGNHVLKIIAYAAPPIKNRPGFKQFELFLDGMPFNTFPRIYELGVRAGGAHARGMVAYEGGGGGGGGQQAYNNYTLPVEEENAWARRVESYENNYSMDRAAPVPAEVSAPTLTATTGSSTDLMSDPINVPGQDLLEQPNALLDTSTPQIAAPAAPAQPDFDFTPQAPTEPTYNDVAGSVLGLYGPGTAAPAPPAQGAMPALPPSTTAPVEQQQQYYAQAPPQPQQQYYQEPVQQQQQQQQQFAAPPQQQFAAPPQQQQYYQEPVPQQYQQPQYEQQPQPQYAGEQPLVTPSKSEELAVVETESPQGVADLDDVTKALKNLVNFDDINEKPVSEELSMYSNPFEKKNELRDDQRKVKKGTVKSKGLAPTSKDYNMTGRSLKEVKELHGGEVRKPPAKEVMKTHAFDPAAAQAGMMVVYGAPQQVAAAPQAYGNYAMPQQQMYQQQPAPPQHDYSQGPPPIGPAAGTGFGIGRVLPGGGYGGPAQPQQQQQQVYASR
mmetsp:Transcript_19750/g.40112  ORF Transcript_19750/g.40112 Transcript_19750/m.40112 type:complete len:611 (-) Transcript_19750:1642-3474(-)